MRNEDGRTFLELEKQRIKAGEEKILGYKTTDSAKTENKFLIKQLTIEQQLIPATPTPTTAPTPFQANDEDNKTWGVATKVGEHTYTMRLKPDDSMATSEETLDALNAYRQKHGAGILSWDDNLASFAKQRADFFVQSGTLDGHKGFLDYLNNQDGFKKLGFSSLGENSSYGFTLTGVHLIEWVYAGDAEHDGNQLNKDWKYVGVGIKDSATNLVFGGEKI